MIVHRTHKWHIRLVCHNALEIQGPHQVSHPVDAQLSWVTMGEELRLPLSTSLQSGVPGALRSWRLIARRRQIEQGKRLLKGSSFKVAPARRHASAPLAASPTPMAQPMTDVVHPHQTSFTATS